MTIVNVSGRPSRRLLRACARFGLVVDAHRCARTPARRCPDPALRKVINAVRHPGITLLAGPSGSGKSRLLTATAGHFAARGVRVIRCLPPRGTTVIDAVPGGLDAALGVLARAGLAEAKLLCRRPDELSDGERWRLTLAVAMQKAACAPRARRRAPVSTRRLGVSSLLIADEWCNALDRATARSVSIALRRWSARMRGVHVIVATSHADVRAWLRPHRVVRLWLGR